MTKNISNYNYMNIESKKIYIIIIVIIAVILYFTNYENNTCLDDTYMDSIISTNKLNKKAIDLVFKIDKQKFKNDNMIKLVDFINENFKNIDEQIEIFAMVKKFMNENRKYDIFNDYIIDNNTTLGNIRNTFLKDNIINGLICSTNKKEIKAINSYFMSLVTATYIKLCTKKDLINYCTNMIKQKNKETEQNKSLNITKPLLAKTKGRPEKANTEEKVDTKEAEKIIEKMTDFLKFDIQDNLVSNVTENFTNVDKVSDTFETISLDKVVSSFSLNSFNETEKPIILKYINNYQKKFNIVLDLKKYKDIVKIVFMIVTDAKKLIQQMKELERGAPNNRLATEFIVLRNIFHKLKHYYKMISYYNIIDAYIEDDVDKNMAMLCCSKEGSNICHNFNDKNMKSKLIVMGFFKNEKESMGYIKTNKCSLPSYEENKILNDRPLLTILKSNNYYKKLSQQVEDKYLMNMMKYFNYFGIDIISPTVKLNDILNKTDDNTKKYLKTNYSKLLRTKSNGINKAFNYNNKYINKMISKINTETNIDKLEILLDKIKNDFDIRSLGDIEMIKSSVITLLKFNYMFTSLGLDNSSANQLIKKLFVYNVDMTFQQLLDEYIISRRYHIMIVKTIDDILKTNKFVIMPKNINVLTKISSIKFTKIVFPVSNELNFCSNWKDLLTIHRRERSIDNKGYLNLKKKVLDLCSKRKEVLKEKELKLLNSNIVEKNIKEIEVEDINNIKHKIMVKEDTGKKVIINNVDDKTKESDLTILNNNQVMKDDSIIKEEHIMVKNNKGELIKMKLNNSFVKTGNEKIIKKSTGEVNLGLYKVDATVKDIDNKERKITLYLRRERDFDLYFFMPKDDMDSLIFKYTMDEKFNFYLYNKLFTKNKVSLMDNGSKIFEVKINKNKLNDFKITKISLIKEYDMYDVSVDHLLKNKLYHFFGKYN